MSLNVLAAHELRLTELEAQLKQQDLKIERLAHQVSVLSDGLSNTLKHLQGFFETVADKLPK